MSEYKGRIDVSKDTMLFVTNSVFGQNIKESTTKENILKMIPNLYREENFDKLIKLLPYDAYASLENLLEFVKNSNDMHEFAKQEEFRGFFYLSEAMIIVMRARYHERFYELNPGVLDNLHTLFNEENKAKARRYAKFEKLIKGILYTYGVVENEFM